MLLILGCTLWPLIYRPDYGNLHYYDCMGYLMSMQQDNCMKIRHIGLVDFDTQHMLSLLEQDAPVVTNQVN